MNSKKSIVFFLILLIVLSGFCIIKDVKADTVPECDTLVLKKDGDIINGTIITGQKDCAALKAAEEQAEHDAWRSLMDFLSGINWNPWN